MSLKPSDDLTAASGPLPGKAPARAHQAVQAFADCRTAHVDGTRTIKVLRKNNRQEVHVRVADLGGTSLIDLRVFEPNGRKGHEPMPTRSGICLPRFQLRALIEALEIAEGGVR